MNEIWKTIEDYPNYMVSNMGRVKSLGNDKTRKEKILKSCKCRGGYVMVNLYKDGKKKYLTIHRLVASAFLNNPDNLPQINHIDEDKTNNRVENLEYCTAEYNSNYGTHNERIAKSLSIPILQFSFDGEFIKKWDNTMDVQRELGIYQSNISSCLKGKRKTAGGYIWKYAS